MRFAPLFVLFLVLVGCGRPEVIVDDGEVIECPPGEVGPRGPAGIPGGPSIVETYVVESDTTTEPGEHIVTSSAICDEGDRVLAGGCSFGDPQPLDEGHDWPLIAVLDAPNEDGTGWTCKGQNTGVGVELKVLRSYAVCLVVEGE
jgi:hypothetical protein